MERRLAATTRVRTGGRFSKKTEEEKAEEAAAKAAKQAAKQAQRAASKAETASKAAARLAEKTRGEGRGHRGHARARCGGRALARSHELERSLEALKAELSTSEKGPDLIASLERLHQRGHPAAKPGADPRRLAAAAAELVSDDAAGLARS